jgi:hypothetical protein
MLLDLNTTGWAFSGVFFEGHILLEYVGAGIMNDFG